LKLIGLTGGAGSGKSTVGVMLRELGAEVLDADEAAHAVYEPGTPGYVSVVREFGERIVRGGRIDRGILGDLVFADSDARGRLNAIVHPLVRELMSQRTVEAADRGAQVVVHEIPLLFENGLQAIYQAVIVVYVPAALQVERLIGRGVDPARARAMVASQMPIDEKRALAQHVIDNSGTRAATQALVVALWNEALVR